MMDHREGWGAPDDPLSRARARPGSPLWGWASRGGRGDRPLCPLNTDAICRNSAGPVGVGALAPAKTRHRRRRRTRHSRRQARGAGTGTGRRRMWESPVRLRGESREGNGLAGGTAPPDRGSHGETASPARENRPFCPTLPGQIRWRSGDRGSRGAISAPYDPRSWPGPPWPATTTPLLAPDPPGNNLRAAGRVTPNHEAQVGGGVTPNHEAQVGGGVAPTATRESGETLRRAPSTGHRPPRSARQARS
jgi:hypothetical protein